MVGITEELSERAFGEFPRSTQNGKHSLASVLMSAYITPVVFLEKVPIAIASKIGIDQYYEILMPLTFVFGSIAMAIAAYSLLYNKDPLGDFAFYFFAAMLFWLFCEYCEHRWNHEGPPEYGIDDHPYHHKCPYDHNEVVMDLEVSIPVYFITVGFFKVVTKTWPFTAAAACGFATAYVMYEWTHFFAHSPDYRLYQWQIRLAHNHRRHHLHQAGRDFSTYFPIFDHIFGTAGTYNWVYNDADNKLLEYAPKKDK